MKRLVYSPSVKVWVKTDSGVIDLSPYVTDCNIERKIDDVSSVEVFFRNPKIRDENGKLRFLFTQKIQNNGNVGPVFHPMDPITVVLERIKGKPVQVFTGYCDTVPYVQLFPGKARLTASCTLKRLLYTYWDPALPFVAKFMQSYGWSLGGDGVVRKGDGNSFQTDSKDPATKKAVSKQVKAATVNDSSIGNLLYAVLHEIGGWNDNNIYIQPLPANIGSIVAKLMDEFTEDNKRANQEVTKFLQDIVGAGQYGGAGLTVTTGVSGFDMTNGNITASPYGNVIFGPGVNTPTDSRNARRMDNIIIGLVHEVAGTFGKSLTIGTGVNHSYLTTTGNVSEHSLGQAADIPMYGDELTKLGRAALKAFGYANWQTANGGLYNINISRSGVSMRVQIIFNTNTGGDHYNHLHVGYHKL